MQVDDVLQIFFESSQEVVREQSIEGKLRRIAEALVRAHLYSRAAVQLYSWAYGEKLFGFAGLSAQDEAWLRTHDIVEHETYQRVARHADALGGPVYFVPHDRISQVLPRPEEYLLSGQITWQGPGFWHPEDMLYCDLTSSDGLHMGNLTADEPFDGRVPTRETATLLAPFVSLAAAVLEQELHRRRDALAGCFNGAVCRSEIERRLTSGRPFALVFADMDNLKHINDLAGHAAGDGAIVDVSRRLDRIALSLPGGKGWVGRLHGDEFLMMFWTHEPEANLESAILRDWTPLLPDVSFGVAVSQPGDTGERLLRRAELAMYSKKRLRKLDSRSL